MTETPALPVFMQRSGFDPVPELAALRDEEGVRKIDFGGGYFGWLVTRYEDVRTVLSDPERFSNALMASMQTASVDDPAMAAELAAAQAGNLLSLDPPEHGRLRRLLTPEFTMRRIGRLEPRITEIVADHLDAMERKGPPADLVADFAMPVPSLVICELLGVPYADRAEFQARAGRQLDIALPPEERMSAAADSRAYMAELVEQSRVAPGEDLLGMLVREHGDDLTSSELTGIAALLLIAGHETTANMIALGTLALLQHPDQLTRLRETTDAKQIAASVEEMLRYLSIVHTGRRRIALEDIEIGGVTIRAGDGIVLPTDVGNRDDSAFSDPNRLDVFRDARHHVAFGFGVHQCLGQPLARVELQIVYGTLYRRIPTLQLAIPIEEVRFKSNGLVYGVYELPVTW